MSTKEMQGKLWSTAPKYWSTKFEPIFIPMYKQTLALLHLDEDMSVLDAGCGSGLFTHMASSTGATVLGVDAAPGLLALARKRNPHINFLEEDLESLPLANESFHVVVGFNSFQYAGNIVNALLEAKRVLKDGGRLVIGIWDRPELSEATTVLKAISTLLPPPPPGTPGPFALSEDGRMESLCESIGLKMIYRTRVSCPMIHFSREDAVRSFMGTGPAAAALNQVNETIVQDTIAKALLPYHLTEGMFHLQNSFLLFIAEK